MGASTTRGDGVFESDRWRQNALVLNGWLVLRFTWKMITEHPDLVIQQVRAALALPDHRRISPSSSQAIVR